MFKKYAKKFLNSKVFDLIAIPFLIFELYIYNQNPDKAFLGNTFKYSIYLIFILYIIQFILKFINLLLNKKFTLND